MWVRAAGAMLLVALDAAGAAAQDVVLPGVEVVGTTPLAGAGQDRDRVPGNTQVLRRSDLERTGPSSLLRALDERVGGVTLDQAQGNPF